jgi:hypothetical protein
VDTGKAFLDITATVRAADMETMKALDAREMFPKDSSVFEVPAPPKKAPATTKILQTKAAVLNLIIFVPTAVPKILAASFPPSDQPIKIPAVKNNPLKSINISPIWSF